VSGRRWNVVVPKTVTRAAGEKTRWVRLGTAFERDEGRIDLHLDALPVDRDWNGQLYLFERDDSEELAPGAAPPPPRRQAGEHHAEPQGGFKLPEGYEHKIHFADGRHPFKGACWTWAKTGNLTTDWEKVTCKRCRKLRASSADPVPPPTSGEPPSAS